MQQASRRFLRVEAKEMLPGCVARVALWSSCSKDNLLDLAPSWCTSLPLLDRAGSAVRDVQKLQQAGRLPHWP